MEDSSEDAKSGISIISSDLDYQQNETTRKKSKSHILEDADSQGNKKSPYHLEEKK